jgi:hypothetical protein
LMIAVINFISDSFSISAWCLRTHGQCSIRAKSN